MRIGISRTIEEDGDQQLQRGRIDPMSIRPVECLDDAGPVKVDMLQNVSTTMDATVLKLELTKLPKALTNAPTSHKVVPSAASRAKLDIISTTWVSRGGLASEMPNRGRSARTVSASLVISGPSWIRVWTRDAPGGRLHDWTLLVMHET